MFKQFFTLARGRSEDVAISIMDANALSILRQQLRDAARGVEKTRKALAVIMAYSERERTSLEKMETQITDLEARALEALEKDHEDLALEASEAIANLEAEASATRNTVSRYASEIARLRICLKDSEAQLIDLKRGLRLAEANERAIKLRGALPDMATTDLEDAAETLKRLQARQEQATATADAMVQLSTKTHAGSLEDRLASAGCGAPRQSDAATVLARLKAARKSNKA